jgi:hypothetical protein
VLEGRLEPDATPGTEQKITAELMAATESAVEPRTSPSVVTVEEKLTAQVHDSETKSSESVNVPRPPGISAPKCDLLPNADSELFHVLDTACVPQRSASGFAFKTKLDKKLYGDSYMRGFGDQLKVSGSRVLCVWRRWRVQPLAVTAQIGIKRQGVLLWRNKQFIRAHLMQDIVMGLIIGSLFWNTSPSAFQVKIGKGALFWCLFEHCSATCL